MKHIAKGDSPAELRKWYSDQRDENGQYINCSYRNLPNQVKQAVKARLLEEQGNICCYTGIAVSDADSHIEHFKPQSKCSEHEDVEYSNLLAAYPGSKQRRCAFGAHAKADWYDEGKLVSPLRQDCETRFRYRTNGHVEPTNPRDEKAIETIEHLQLDHAQLVELRSQIVRAVLYRGNDHLSDRQLEIIVQRYCSRNKGGGFPAFCFVVSQAAKELLQKSRNKRERDKALRREKKS